MFFRNVCRFFQATRRKEDAVAKQKVYFIISAMQSFLFPRYQNKYLSRLFAYSQTGGMYVQCIDSEVCLKLLYLLLPAEVMSCLVGERNVISNCGCRYTHKVDVMLRFQA